MFCFNKETSKQVHIFGPINKDIKKISLSKFSKEKHVIVECSLLHNQFFIKSSINNSKVDLSENSLILLRKIFNTKDYYLSDFISAVIPKSFGIGQKADNIRIKKFVVNSAIWDLNIAYPDGTGIKNEKFYIPLIIKEDIEYLFFQKI